MFPQQYQGQAFNPQSWGGTQFAPQGLNLNDVVHVISRILPLLQLQGNQFAPQTSGFGFPQQFAPQGLFQNPMGQPGPLFPFQPTPWAGQSSAFGYPQFLPQGTNPVDIVNVLARVLPVLQQSGMTGQPGAGFGFPQQHFAAQGINPEIVNVISRIVPYLGTQTNPSFQTGVTGYGSHGNPYIH